MTRLVIPTPTPSIHVTKPVAVPTVSMGTVSVTAGHMLVCREKGGLLTKTLCLCRRHFTIYCHKIMPLIPFSDITKYIHYYIELVLSLTELVI